MAVRLPRLLNADMSEKARLRPSQLSAAMKLHPLSAAAMTLPEGEAPVNIRDFAELYGPEGSLGIFRVSGQSTVYGSGQVIHLEHGIVTLGDDMTHADTVLTGDLKAMLNALLSFQTRAMWRLGRVESDLALSPVEASRVTLLDGVLTLLRQDDTVMAAFDQTAFPWTLHVLKKPEKPSCECRLNRNLSGVNLTFNDQDLCTRVTVQGPDGGSVTLNADTQDIWGVTHRFLAAEGDIEAQGRRYLKERKNPGLSIELDALALSELTGEPWDTFHLGHICRVALPEWGVTEDQRIVCISYPDLMAQPQSVRLTLCNQVSDTAARLNALQSAVRQSAAQSLKYYRELDDRAEILAGEIALRATKYELTELEGRQAELYSQVSIELDAAKAELDLKASHDEVTQVSHALSEAEIKLSGLEAKIELAASKEEVTELTRRLSSAEIDIDGLNASIALKASQSAMDALTGRMSRAEASLTVQAGEISSKVSADGIASAINQTAQSVLIQASKINLSGYVTASQLKAEIADFSDTWSAHIETAGIGAGEADIGVLTATTVGADNLSVSHLTAGGHEATWKSVNVVTSVGLSTSGTGLYAYPSAGSESRQFYTVLLSADLTKNTETIHYLGY